MVIWVVVALVGYLLGSIPVGFLIGKLSGLDVRNYGSGATGGTNVLRTLGWRAAVTTGVSDIVKGTLAALIGYWLGQEWGYCIGGMAAILGHSYPVWLRFKGGKSVATGAGALLLFHPIAFLAGLTAGLAAVLPTRYVSLGSLVGALVFCGAVWFSSAHPAHKLLAFSAYLVVFVRHWSNMKRIAAGTENKFGQKAKSRTQP